MLPSIYSSSEMPLRACDSNDIQWIDFSDSGVEFHSWKLRSYQFRSIIPNLDQCYDHYVNFCNSVIKDSDDPWEHKRFRQPISHPILDVIFLKNDLQCFRKLKLDIKKVVLEKPAFNIPFKEKAMKILLTVVASSVSENARLQVTVDDNGQVQTIDLGKIEKKPREEKADPDQKKNVGEGKKAESGGSCSIEMDQSCLANLLFSDALSNISLKKNFKSFLLNKHGKNIWGKDKAISVHSFTLTKESDRDNLATNAADFLWNVLEVWSKWGPISICEHNIFCDMSSNHAQNIPTSDALWVVNRGDPIPKQTVSCCYCGCNFVIPTYARELLAEGPGKFCCRSHADFEGKQSKIQTPIFGMTKPDKVLARQCQDPARDKNLTNLYQRICELEKLLHLNITVGTQDMLYLSSGDVASFPLRLRFQIRRDEYDGDAHLSFFIEGSTELLCGKKQKRDMVPHSKFLKKNIRVSVSFCCQNETAEFATNLSTFPDCRELEVPLTDRNKLKVQLSGFYGRICKNGDDRDLAICTENEGCKIPSECMRRLLEPEYYSYHRAAYPFIQFKVTVPQDDGILNDSVPMDDEVPSINSAQTNPTTFVAVASSHCFEEFWLDDTDWKPPEEDKMNATEEKTESLQKLMKLVENFRDTLRAESELNLSVFSKTQRQKNHLDILDGPEIVSQIEQMSADEQIKERKEKLLSKLKELVENEKVKLSPEYTMESTLSEMKREYIRLKVEKDIQHLDDQIRKKQEKFSLCVDTLLGCLEALVGSKVIHKNLVNLKLLETFKFFLNSDSLVLKVWVFVLQLFMIFTTRIALLTVFWCWTSFFTAFSRSKPNTLSGFVTWEKNWSVSVNFQQL